MAIPDEDVARVLASTDMLAVLGEHVGLKRVGTRWVGLCPFHTEKTPSFSVNPQLGFYRCFGCGASGDVITFVRETEHLSFVEAVEKLAARAGIALQADDPDATARRHRRAQLAAAMAKAVAWYHDRLLSSPDAAAARAYLRGERGYDGEIVRRYQLGWAPAGWDTLARALNLPDHVLRDAGLGFLNSGGRPVDAFRGRVLFPIFDHTGAAVAIGGRILPGSDGPKYKNSSETPLYRKSEVLYGLNWAKDDVVRSGQAVVCEGYTDVIAFREAGVPTAVATCGTAVTEDHIRRLKNFGAARLVLGYDADSAGQGAAERFYAWEAKHQVDIAVAALPSGSDPADVARRDPTALVAAVAEARPFLSFRLERLWPTCDLRTAEGRARAAEAAMAIINEHPSQLVKDRYIMQVSGFTGAEPDVLRRSQRTGGRIRVTARPTNQRKDLRGDEVEALWLAIHQPELVADRLEAVLFTDEVAVGAFLALASSDTFAQAVERADADAADLLTRLAVEDHGGSDADHVLVALAQQAGIRLRAKLLRVASIGDEDAMRVNDRLRTLQGLLAELQGDDRRIETSMALVAFVVHSAEEGV
jgi:DNA primase